ncbi:unnamed protein product [Paramecium octaurelia]|uniref:Uncharacterized protein n=1 Tax=Paramecium octaurelia TaxID=43137 RepID=A0A8S1XE71_PAROT|nr:unnamed protein product [Paramecium octaurelia]
MNIKSIFVIKNQILENCKANFEDYIIFQEQAFDRVFVFSLGYQDFQQID